MTLLLTRIVICLALLVGLATTINAQRPDRNPKNLQYFPKDTPRSEIVAQMRNFSFALGVACTHCHGTEQQTGFNLQGVDFSLDIKPTKTTAREMLRMLDQINAELLTKVSNRSALGLKVECFTCHAGLPQPEKIEDRFQRRLASNGIAAAVADYRQTRQRYYGSAAYNFKEQPLVEVASQLLGSQKYEEAAAVSQLNLEFHPDSGQSKFGLAEAYTRLGKKAEARKLYEELLALRPNDQRLKARLEALGT